jgi:hypothetical protein
VRCVGEGRLKVRSVHFHFSVFDGLELVGILDFRCECHKIHGER